MSHWINIQQINIELGCLTIGSAIADWFDYGVYYTRLDRMVIPQYLRKRIYGIILQRSDIGETDVFLDLIETLDATYNDLNKLTRGPMQALNR
ncbi:hypothetical protein SAMN04487950_3311 [Halogranum rubrum]|uniref:Uncharacterized protein n=1 Tax=Halogranum rubrum TaxID=553466 RepID=A0A1I4GRL3_9EURY|nr:hypothetical protein SAMN04487950_3311 [Halogranum rubrum]